MSKYRTQIIIDNAALLHNIQQVNYLTKDSLPIIAMVKANAYGHGMISVSRVLAPKVDIFGVACLEEAKTLRAIMPDKPILLFSGVFSEQEWEDIFTEQFDVMIHAFWQIESLLRFPTEKKINVWIKIDTGMHRLGFFPEEVPNVYAALMKCEKVNQPIGLMTHFACADELTNPLTENQIQRFESTVSSFSSKKWSLANSAGIIAWPAARQGYIRPGIMLYGISPFADKIGKDLGLKPVMCLQSHITTIKTCQKGESVGYGATWRANKISRLATVSIGYGDGYPRHLSSDAVVWCHHHYFSIVGRISMDMLLIDVSSDPTIQVGERVELWGPHLPVEKVAKFANTSAYELVTQMRAR